jgi:uncharacterized protein CbrC (UPF0167 family)
MYVGPVYSAEKLRGTICPWCIADGSAAQKFKASFSDLESLAGKVSDDVINEVQMRTPGFISWQQGEWLACCRDACEFHGDAPKAELQALAGGDLMERLHAMNLEASDWDQMVKHYHPGGSPAVYKFVCRHCRKIQYSWDCD